MATECKPDSQNPGGLAETLTHSQYFELEDPKLGVQQISSLLLSSGDTLPYPSVMKAFTFSFKNEPLASTRVWDPKRKVCASITLIHQHPCHRTGFPLNASPFGVCWMVSFHGCASQSQEARFSFIYYMVTNTSIHLSIKTAIVPTSFAL